MLALRRLCVSALVACVALAGQSVASASPVASAAAAAALQGTTGMPVYTMAEWRWLDIWQNDAAAYQAYADNKVYEKVVLAGVKEWRPSARDLWAGVSPRVFVSTPRSHHGESPATLHYIDFEHQGRGGGPLLQPYPNLELNTVGQQDALQSVVGFEIDAFNRMWILDQGRVGGQPAANGTIKLVIWDVLLDVEVHRYEFPQHVAHPDTAYLKDIVLDQPRGFAYISDSGMHVHGGDTDAGIIVFDLNARTHETRSWRMLSSHYSVQPEVGFNFQVGGLPINASRVGVDGIALTPDGLFLFYSPLTSRELYMIPTCVLRANATEVVDEAVVHVLTKPGVSDGMAFTFGNGPAPVPLPPSAGVCHHSELPRESANTPYELLVTDLEHNSVWSFEGNLAHVNANRTDGDVITPVTIALDDRRLVWPDTIGFRADGTFVVSSNFLNAFEAGVMDFDNNINFRLETVFSPLLAPRFAYNSLPKNADVLTLFGNSSYCFGTPMSHHVVVGQGSQECLYTPHNGGSLRMTCDMNSTGRVEANFQAFIGEGCNPAAQQLYAGSVHANDHTCAPITITDPVLPAPFAASAKASCFDEPQRVEFPPSGEHIFIGHGHVDTCDRTPVAIHRVMDGQCTEIVNDGHFLKITCDAERLAKFSFHRDGECKEQDIIQIGYGLGDGADCIPFTTPFDGRARVVLGSAAIMCGYVAPVPPPKAGSSGVKTGVAVLLFFIGLFIGLGAMVCIQKWRAKQQSAQSHDGYQNQLLG